jgi:TRAP-type C4-dicarboxylate transport system permease small subunit
MNKSTKQRNILPPRDFARRMFLFFLIATAMIIVSLWIGILGYHYFAELNWTDSLLNASMILTGMGPVDRLTNDTAKVFASFYSLFSGVAFLSTVAIFFSPIAHRLLHLLHVENKEEEEEEEEEN